MAGMTASLARWAVTASEWARRRALGAHAGDLPGRLPRADGVRLRGPVEHRTTRFMA